MRCRGPAALDLSEQARQIVYPANEVRVRTSSSVELQYHYLKKALPYASRDGGELDLSVRKSLSLDRLEEACEQTGALPVISSIPCGQEIKELRVTPLFVVGAWRSVGLVA
jgi:hypothetical protein